LPIRASLRVRKKSKGEPAANQFRATKDITIRIEPYTEEFTRSVAEFNQRVRPAGAPFEVPETPVPAWLPKTGDQKVYQEIFLAIEEDRVRGAYTLKHQEFSFWGRILSVGDCRMPISEGIIDKQYGLVGVRLIEDALRKQPLMYGLGIGSQDALITRLVLAKGWRLSVVPFFFKVRNGFQFLRNIQYLRTTWLRKVLLDMGAYSGLGWTGARLAHTLLTRNGHHSTVEQAPEFSTWADELWQTSRDQYSMAAVRDANVLNILYPPDDPKFIRLKVFDGGAVVGWAVLLDTVMSGNKYFGNMRVGSIVDCLARPENAGKVMAAATVFLEQRGADLLVSNQAHSAWGQALTKAGFVAGPSNFFFVTAKQMTTLLDDIDRDRRGIHLTRGDGDGPIHL